MIRATDHIVQATARAGIDIASGSDLHMSTGHSSLISTTIECLRQMDLTIFSKNGFISITEQPAPRYIYVIKGTGTSQNATRNEGMKW